MTTHPDDPPFGCDATDSHQRELMGDGMDLVNLVQRCVRSAQRRGEPQLAIDLACVIFEFDAMFRRAASERQLKRRRLRVIEGGNE